MYAKFCLRTELSDPKTEPEKENIKADDAQVEEEDEFLPDVPAHLRRHL